MLKAESQIKAMIYYGWDEDDFRRELGKSYLLEGKTVNLVVITGRLTRDPVVSYGASNQKAVARFNLAVDRPKGEDGKSSADFPNVVCFGKTAEMVEKYLRKGKKIGVQGRILTSKYDKDGSTIYSTDVVADRIEFLESKKDENGNPEPAQGKPVHGTVPEGFQALDDDIPFGGM